MVITCDISAYDLIRIQFNSGRKKGRLSQSVRMFNTQRETWNSCICPCYLPIFSHESYLFLCFFFLTVAATLIEDENCIQTALDCWLPFLKAIIWSCYSKNNNTALWWIHAFVAGAMSPSHGIAIWVLGNRHTIIPVGKSPGTWSPFASFTTGFQQVEVMEDTEVKWQAMIVWCLT